MKTYTHTFNYLIAVFFIAILNSSCAVFQGTKKSKKNIPSFQKQIEESPVFDKSFTGFHLFDPATNQIIYSQNDDKYFTPASNTKIFTLYTSLNILGDSLPALRYTLRKDSLIFWGTGDPSLLHHYLPENNRVVDFLKSRTEKLYFSSHNFETNHFGSGWAWDDYYYYYQPEKSAMPIYGNVVQFDKAPENISYSINPPVFGNVLRPNYNLKDLDARIVRQRFQNIFEYNPSEAMGNKYGNDLPFKYSDLLFVNLLSEKTGKTIQVYPYAINDIDNANTIFSLPSKMVYAKLMQDSDNFIAEQLLLACSSVMYDTLSTDRVIEYAKENLLSDLIDEPLWHDGSGLSRYNLFTPRSVAKLLHKLYQLTPSDLLFEIFPAGGQSGTIQNWYGGQGQPFVFAKTGTLSNVHCLSGYLRAASGKVYIFSFMHNNFSGSSKPLKEEMQKVLNDIYTNY